MAISLIQSTMFITISIVKFSLIFIKNFSYVHRLHYHHFILVFYDVMINNFQNEYFWVLLSSLLSSSRHRKLMILIPPINLQHNLLILLHFSITKLHNFLIFSLENLKKRVNIFWLKCCSEVCYHHIENDTLNYFDHFHLS